MTLCVTLACWLNGSTVAFTGPTLPSLLNITGNNNDGHNIWGNPIVISPQEAGWISQFIIMAKI